MRHYLPGILLITSAVALPPLGVVGINRADNTEPEFLLALFLLAAAGFFPFGIGLGAASLARARSTRSAPRTSEVDRAVAEAGWAHGAWLLRHLSHGGTLPPLTVPELVLYPGEQIHLDLVATTSRFYATAERPHTSTQMYIGPPFVVATGALLGAISDSAHRSRACAAALPQWRDHQPVRVLATTHRLVCIGQGQLTNFDHAAIAAFHADLTNWTVTLEFHDTAPLRLRASHIPALAVWLCSALFGAGALPHHPALSLLR